MPELTMTYWYAIWILMALAFLVAWFFIIRGCQVLDQDTLYPGTGDSPADSLGSSSKRASH
jgi:hypothetical protein